MTATIELVVEPRERDLGGFTVRRVLPFAQRRNVGPFVFLDHMGPASFEAGQGIDVRPHPHIGLATVTYLFDGEILHHDSLGSLQPIRPGDVNWMSAGRGITHSERTSATLRASGQRLHGLQSWVALPVAQEESAPSFRHYPAAALPGWELQGAALRLVAGTAYGRRSPVETLSPLFYVMAELPAGASLPVDEEHEERAVYVVDGSVVLAEQRLSGGQLAVLSPGPARLRAVGPARVALLGGAPLDAPRTIWWNFVSSRKERIDQAKEDWRAGRFPAVPHESDFIPLP